MGGGTGTFTLDDMRREDDEPIWSSHLDEDSGEVYYYNRLSRASVWVKPKDFDGYDILSGQGAMRNGDAESREAYERTFGLKFA